MSVDSFRRPIAIYAYKAALARGRHRPLRPRSEMPVMRLWISRRAVAEAEVASPAAGTGACLDLTLHGATWRQGRRRPAGRAVTGGAGITSAIRGR
jgi:hypothetical protein